MITLVRQSSKTLHANFGIQVRLGAEHRRRLGFRCEPELFVVVVVVVFIVNMSAQSTLPRCLALGEATTSLIS